MAMTHLTIETRRGGDTRRGGAILALAAAGALWGLTVPLSKLGLEWLGASWLTVARFGLAAPLLAVLARRNLRAALTPGVAAAGALGYGAVILLQNAGIERTSVSHAALVVGAVPVLVAIIAAAVGRATAGAAAWVGSLVAVAGVGLVASGGGAGATLAGDLLVLASVAGAAGLIVLQPRLLAGRDPGAVTAVQLGAAALAALPVAAIAEGAPAVPAAPAPVAAVTGLGLAGTLAAFWLFAWAQARVPAELAGAFVNLEPLVGAICGVVAFGDAVGLEQALGGLAILAGIAVAALAGGRPRRADRGRRDGTADSARSGARSHRADRHGRDGTSLAALAGGRPRRADQPGRGSLESRPLDTRPRAREDPRRGGDHHARHRDADAARDPRDPRVLPHEPDADLLRLADGVQPARHRPLVARLLLHQLLRLVRGQPPARVRAEGAAVPRVRVDGGRLQPPARAQGGARPDRARRPGRQGGVRHVRRRDREGGRRGRAGDRAPVRRAAPPARLEDRHDAARQRGRRAERAEHAQPCLEL